MWESIYQFQVSFVFGHSFDNHRLQIAGAVHIWHEGEEGKRVTAVDEMEVCVAEDVMN